MKTLTIQGNPVTGICLYFDHPVDAYFRRQQNVALEKVLDFKWLYVIPCQLMKADEIVCILLDE